MALALAVARRTLRLRPALRRHRPRLSPSQPVTPRLSVIIVNYCLWEETAKLVGQLLATPCVQRGDVEVVVVDNHSPAHPLARRLRRRSGVSLRRWGKNRGFAQAVNEGCRLSRGRWLLLLNPDISVGPGFLEGVLALGDRLAAEEPRAGIVGFQLRNSDGSRQLSAGPTPTLLGTLARLGLPRTRRKYHCLTGRRRRPVAWVTGCCMLVRRGCLEQLGGLDREFFLYYEDVDLCERARAKGWGVWYEPALRATHHHPLHQRTVPAYLRLLTRHALLTYAAKHWPAWQCRILAGVVAAEARLRGFLSRRKGDIEATALFDQLRAIAGDMGRGHAAGARRQLEQVIRREDRQHAP